MFVIDDILGEAFVPDPHRAGLQAHLDETPIGTRVHILVVAGTEVSTPTGVGFGIRPVIDETRATRVVSRRLEVDIARRDALPSRIVAVPDAGGACCTGFLVDMKQADGVEPVLHQLHGSMGLQEFSPQLTGPEPGTHFKRHLVRWFGPCS